MKDKIVNGIKFCIFCYAMVMGVFTTFAIAWVSMGLPIYWWSAFIGLALSVAATWGYISWIAE